MHILHLQHHFPSVNFPGGSKNSSIPRVFTCWLSEGCVSLVGLSSPDASEGTLDLATCNCLVPWKRNDDDIYFILQKYRYMFGCWKLGLLALITSDCVLYSDGFLSFVGFRGWCNLIRWWGSWWDMQSRIKFKSWLCRRDRVRHHLGTCWYFFQSNRMFTSLLVSLYLKFPPVILVHDLCWCCLVAFQGGVRHCWIENRQGNGSRLSTLITKKYWY